MLMKLEYPMLMDRYEFKARLLPALLSSFVVAPVMAILASYKFGWPSSVSMGTGLGVAWAVGLTYAASAAGRYYEKKLWPRWPHDAPTNRWLHPDDTSCSKAQKELWYAAIERHVGLRIPERIRQGEFDEVDRTINDAVRELRSQFRSRNLGGLLAIHNEDYGFTRNLAGLNLLCWLPITSLSTVVAWTAYFFSGAELTWGISASALMLFSILLLRILPWYVRQRADRYTESFFGALMALNRESENPAPARY